MNYCILIHKIINFLSIIISNDERRQPFLKDLQSSFLLPRNSQKKIRPKELPANSNFPENDIAILQFAEYVDCNFFFFDTTAKLKLGQRFLFPLYIFFEADYCHHLVYFLFPDFRSNKVSIISDISSRLVSLP